MKKILILSIIIISTSILTGCNEKTNKVVTHKMDENTIEYKSNSNKVEETSNIESNVVDTSNSNVTSNTTKTSNTTVKSNTTSNKKSNTTSNKTSNKENDYFLIFTTSYNDYNDNNIVYRSYSPTPEEVFGLIIGYNKNGKEIWRYTTKTVEDVQFPIYEFLGGDGYNIFLKENSDVIVINSNTGKEVSRIKNLAYRLELLNSDDNYIYIANGDSVFDFINYIYVIDRKTYKLKTKVSLSEKYANSTFEVDHAGYLILSQYENEKDVPKYKFKLSDVANSNWSESKITEIK